MLSDNTVAYRDICYALPDTYMDPPINVLKQHVVILRYDTSIDISLMLNISGAHSNAVKLKLS